MKVRRRLDLVATTTSSAAVGIAVGIAAAWSGSRAATWSTSPNRGRVAAVVTAGAGGGEQRGEDLELRDLEGPAARGHQTQRALHPVDRPPDAGHRARPAASNRARSAQRQVDREDAAGVGHVPHRQRPANRVDGATASRQ